MQNFKLKGRLPNLKIESLLTKIKESRQLWYISFSDLNIQWYLFNVK